MTFKQRANRENFLMTLPAVLFYVFGIILPIIIGFNYSLTDWDGISQTRNFIGFENYLQIFQEERFYNSLGFTMAFVLFNTIAQNIFALLFALLLDTGIRGRNFYKTIVYAPCLLSPILIGYLWNKMFTKIYPGIFEVFSIDMNIQLLTDPNLVLWGLLIMNNWQWIGYWMLIYIAALQAVPLELYEASYIEGANVVQQFYKVTLPMIMPAVTICVVSITLGGFQVYELIVTATGGGPGHASESFIMYIYNLAFASERAAFASANSMIYVLFLFMIAIIQVKILRKREVQL